MRFLTLLLPLLLATAGALAAQDLEETLSDVGSDYAREYVRPLSNALGANLNSGLYHDARPTARREGLNVYLGVRAFGTFLTDGDRTFDLTFRDDVTIDATVQGERVRVTGPATFEVVGAPTVFGEEDPAFATVTARFDTTVTRFGVAVPVSVDTTFSQELVGGVVPTDIVPTAVPHLQIGTVFGTDLMIRYLPTITASDLGSIGLFGVGVRHSIAQYAPELPLDVAVHLAWQRVYVDDEEAADLVDVSTFAAGVMLSRRFGPLSLYGALQTERSEIEVQYDLDVSDEVDDLDGEVDLDDAETVRIAFEQRGAAEARGLLGLALRLGPFHLHADYSVGTVGVLTAGIGFAF